MRKSILALLVVCILLPSTLSAQYRDSSRTADVTQFLFTADRDSYLSPLYFNFMDKTTLFLGFGMPDAVNSGYGVESDPAFRAGIGLPLDFMYVGAFTALKDYLAGNLVPNQVSTINKSQVWLYDTFGNLVNNTATTVKNVEYTNTKSNQFNAVVGLKLGDINLGIYNGFKAVDSSKYGNFDGTAWGTITTTGTAATTIEVLNAAGTSVRKDSEEYALGNSMLSTGLTDNFTLGLTLPLGEMKLLADAGVTFVIADTGVIGAKETYTTRPSMGYAAFTPTTFLPGKTAAAIADVSAYGFYDQKYVQSLMKITPALNAKVEMGFELGVPVTFNGGLGFNYAINSRTASYNDTALVAQTVTGNASSYRSVIYTTASAVLNEVQTTLVDTRRWRATTYTADGTLNLSVPLSMTFKPVGDFQFAIGLTPAFAFGNTAYSSTGGRLVTKTYSDGDAVTTLDPDDYVEIRTVTNDKITTAETTFNFSSNFCAAAQFYMIPQKLRFNLGAITVWNPIRTSTITETTDSLYTDVITKQYGDQTAAVTTTYFNDDPYPQTEGISGTANLAVYYQFGMTFFFSDNMYIDMRNQGGDIFTLSNWTIDLTIKL